MRLPRSSSCTAHLASRVAQQALGGALACVLGACASAPAAPIANGDPRVVGGAASNGAIEIPTVIPRAIAKRRIVATHLQNPRGMHHEGNTLLVSEAGNGDPASAPSGGLIQLIDANADGDYLDQGERRTLLTGQPSRNIFDVVRRDEVFGMAGMDAGDGVVMVALAFFGGPSTLFTVKGDAVEPWGRTHGNINDVAYDPGRKLWYGASSTTDEIVQLLPGNGSQRVLKLPTLASGQDAVPGYLLHDPVTGDLLVSLFSGSPEGEEGGAGTELVPRSAAIVRVSPDAKSWAPVITGLTVPTDLVVGEDGSIYVLEFCDAFLDPIATREAMTQTGHGGFRRFSGRLLRIDRKSGAVEVLAEGLDAPTNLARAPGGLYVAEGMGTPGRLIPGADGPVPLDGFIELIELR